MSAFVSPIALNAALGAASAVTSGKDAAYINSLVAQFGSTVRREVYANGVLVLSAPTNAALSRVGTQMRLGPASGVAVAAAATSATLVHRVVSDSNPSNFIDSTMGATGSGAAFTLSAGFTPGQTVSLLEAFYNGPGLPETLSLSLGSVTNIAATSFTLSVVVGGTIPAGAVTEIQWTDGIVPWVKSPTSATTVGTFSHTFTGAPSSTLIRWRAFVFTPPSTTHASTAEGTFYTLAAPGGGGENYVDVLMDDMRVGLPPSELPGISPGAALAQGGYITMGADLRPGTVPSWFPHPDYGDSYAYYTYLLPWLVVWDRAGHQAGLNVRCQLADLQLFVLQDGWTQWQMIGSAVAPGGGHYARDIVDGNATGESVPPRAESVGMSVKIIPNGLIWHGFDGGSTNYQPTALRAVHTRVRFRKIIESGTIDQRSLARYMVQVGLDPYPEPGFGWGAPGQYNPASGGSKFKEATNDWQWVYYTSLGAPPTNSVDTSVRSTPKNTRHTISEADVRALPPPPP